MFYYFQFLQEFLSVGPPFYIVVNSTNLKFDFAELESRNKMCGSYGCNEDSLQNTVALWSKVANKTYVASPAFSWVDDYDAFMKAGKCCSYHEENPLNICYSEDYLVNPPRDKSTNNQNSESHSVPTEEVEFEPNQRNTSKVID